MTQVQYPGDQKSNSLGYSTLHKRGGSTITNESQPMENGARSTAQTQRLAQPIFGKKKYHLQKMNYKLKQFQRNSLLQGVQTLHPGHQKTQDPSGCKMIGTSTSMDRSTKMERKGKETDFSVKIKRMSEEQHQRPSSIMHNPAGKLKAALSIHGWKQ